MDKQANRYNLIVNYSRLFKVAPTQIESLVDRVISMVKGKQL